MTKKQKLAMLAGAIALLLSLSIYNVAGSSVVYETVTIEIEKKDPLTYQQRAWVGVLTWCESGGNPNAKNPNDKDGTPSYGLLQFKPSTFYSFGKLYGIDTSKGYTDPDAQLQIIEQMVLHRDDIKWERQFPDCVKKYGKPPKAIHS